MGKFFKQNKVVCFVSLSINFVFFCLIFIFVLPWLISQTWPDFITKFNQATANVGDTIGGITAPFVGLLSAVLIYMAFREQVSANQMLKEQSRIQDMRQNIEFLLERLEKTVYGYSFEPWPKAVTNSIFRGSFSFGLAMQAPRSYASETIDEDLRLKEFKQKYCLRGEDIKGRSAYHEFLRIKSPLFHPPDKEPNYLFDIMESNAHGITLVLEHLKHFSDTLNRYDADVKEFKEIENAEFLGECRRLLNQLVKFIDIPTYELNQSYFCQLCKTEHFLPQNFYMALCELHKSLKTEFQPPKDSLCHEIDGIQVCPNPYMKRPAT
jgi:hypothetical protein